MGIHPSMLHIPGQYPASGQGQRMSGVRAMYTVRTHAGWLTWIYGPWEIEPGFIVPHGPLWSNASGP